MTKISSSDLQPQQFVRITDGSYAGMTGVYVGETLGAWGTVDEGTWVCVRLTSTGQYVTMRPCQIRAELRSSEAGGVDERQA